MKPKFFLLPVVIGLIILVCVFIYQQRKRFVNNTNQSAVVLQIQQLNKLETAQFTIEKIIDSKTVSSNIFQEFLYGDKILLIAHGEVVAGFDLSKISKEDIKIQENRLTVSLPPPEILYTRIDNDKTKVYDRTQGLLTKGNKDLESEARLRAEESIRKAACDAKILDQATDSVKKQLKTMFGSYGYSEITINVPAGTC